MRLLIAGLVVLLLSSAVVVPVQAQDDDGRDARLGGTRKSIENESGKPVNNRKDDAARYKVDDYGLFQVTCHKDRVLQFTIFAKGKEAPLTAAFGDNWSRGDAISEARGFLPKDAKVRDQQVETEDQNWAFQVTSRALEDTFAESTYERYDVGGKPGDAYILLYLSEDETVYAMDISIGSAEEAVADRWKADVEDEGISEEEQAYIDRLKDEINTVRQSAHNLSNLFSRFPIGNDEWTIAVAANLVTFQLAYQSAIDDPPPTSRLEGIHALRISYLSVLDSAAADYITGFDTLNAEVITTGNDKIIEATSIVTELLVMLNAFEADPSSFGSNTENAPTPVPTLVTGCEAFTNFDEANAYYAAYPESQPYLDPDFDGLACEVFFGVGHAAYPIPRS